jgi:hypothetical protein
VIEIAIPSIFEISFESFILPESSSRHWHVFGTPLALDQHMSSATTQRSKKKKKKAPSRSAPFEFRQVLSSVPDSDSPSSLTRSAILQTTATSGSNGADDGVIRKGGNGKGNGRESKEREGGDT